MPFDHNDHYHPLLLRQVPRHARTALDVGCGTGRFARRLAATGLTVDALDVAPDMVEAARALGSPGPGTIRYRVQDVSRAELPAGRYDVVSCLAALHHMPFATVAALRTVLAPGGVLAVLGLGRPSTAGDWTTWIAAMPVNLAARAVVAAGERLNGGPDPLPHPPIRDTTMTMAEIRRESARLLPGRRVRVLPFWRYLLTYREPELTR
ncbi:Methyltransferase domain-containing protein [Amycolatopsis arida]|uniref:Methyltransferase domain-containing protein n=1 Tax=Amycolatopsis arida TaxID=587909 RepID=A0A1I5UQH9_9PSEU|nr:class I SAM-dependent methyltransferase [Amycolatopsis arida]TDX90999.1 methyltransferase family protein [Amycolatopsis arida]SFP97564.1 Methyltransferase domain-containing protein [Amycolatopsis arida]